MGHRVARFAAPLLALPLVLLLATSVAAQGASPAAVASPTPRPAGELGTAQREYKASTSRLTGTLDFQFRVAVFDTPAHAAAALNVVGPNFRAQFPTLSPLPIPLIGDQAFAFDGRVKEGTTTVRVAVLIVRHVSDDYAFIGVGFYDDPIGDLLRIASRLFPSPASATPPATPVATPPVGVSPAALLARLPELSDLPPGGYVLVSQTTTNGAGTPTP